MSLVIAIRDKDRIVLGSDKQSSYGVNKQHDATKIWESVDIPGALIGGVGMMRASQIIQYNKIVDLNELSDTGLTTEFIINSVVPGIVSQLQSHGVFCGQIEEKDVGSSIMIPNTFIFAFEDRAWIISPDLSVSELGDYLAIGSGSDVANGALYATPDKNPFERIVTSIKAAAETTLFVDDEIDFLVTKPYAKDEQALKKAMGVFEQAELTIENSEPEKPKEEAKTKKKSKAKKKK